MCTAIRQLVICARQYSGEALDPQPYPHPPPFIGSMGKTNPASKSRDWVSPGRKGRIEG